MSYSHFDQWVDPVAVISPDFRLRYGNDALATFFGVRRRMLTSEQPLSDVLKLPEDLRQGLEARDPKFFGGYSERSLQNADGQSVTMQVLISDIGDEGDMIMLFRDVSVEIGLHKRYLGQIGENEALIARLRRQLQEMEVLRGLVELDQDENTDFFLGEVAALVQKTLKFDVFEIVPSIDGTVPFNQLSRNTRLGSHFRNHISLFESQIAAEPNKGFWTVFNLSVLKIQSHLAKNVWVFIQQSPTVGRSEPEFFKLFGHQVGRMLEARALMKSSMTDHLTGLFNRRAFEARLALETSRAKDSGLPVSLILVDLDHFKSVNDKWGHPAGDSVLKSVGQTLGDVIRRKDAAYRLGGEEFGILLIGSSVADARVFAERLRENIGSKKIEVTGPDGQPVFLSVTASLGLAEFGFGLSTPEQIYSACDEALYEAKRTGRNKTVAA